jgi:hypothetical protein
MDIDDVPLLYRGRKRLLYQRAVQSLTIRPLTKKDAYLKCFVKAERINPGAKVNPDPRMIQYRGARYAMALAQFLKPIEHDVYELDCFCAGVPKTRSIAKGLNANDRAKLLVLKMSHFRDPLVVTIDASRFDKHVSQMLLRVEHAVYLCCNNSPLFIWLLGLQLVNVVFGAEGQFQYITNGRRMSGDMNTALGNCLIMLIMLMVAVQIIGLDKFDTLDDGDDCLLMVERSDRDKLAQLVPIFLRFGMQLKIEGWGCIPEGVVFCQSRALQFDTDRWKMVRDPWKIMSCALTGARHWENLRYRKKAIAAIGLCELVLNLGVPVLQAYACALLRNAGETPDLEYASDGRRVVVEKQARAIGVPLHKLRAQPITNVARNSFAIGWGIDEPTQVEMERFLDTWEFNIDGPRYQTPWFHVDHWRPAPRADTYLYAPGNV